MQSLSEVSLVEFREALTPTSVRTSQIIHVALGAGVLVFFSCVLFIYSHQPIVQPDESEVSFVNVLTLVHLVFAMAAIFAGKLLAHQQFSESNLQQAVSRDFTDKQGEITANTSAEKCVLVIRTASILRLATLEGAAFFGLTVTMVAVMNGVLPADPVYFCNLASVIIVLAYIATTFPTADRFESIFQSRIRKSG